MSKLISIFICLSVCYSSCFSVTQSQRDIILSSHNLVRSEYDLPSLIWDTKIEKQAQEWANTMMKNNNFSHSTTKFRKGMWENIYSISGQSVISDGSDATMFWYGEQWNYNYRSNSCTSGGVCGHFTQLVWKNTKRVGCGQSVKKKGNITTVYWVCQYDPAGNYDGQRPY
jgi:pathogenesis-related protein 1